MTTLKGYKGFNSQLQCVPDGKIFQYEVGKEYEHPGNPSLCREGFHFCENPLDVLRYYGPADSRYAEVEAEEVAAVRGEDTKRVAKKMKVVAELNLKSLIELGVKFLLEKTEKATSGDYSPSATSGNYAHSATSGDYSPSATSGDYSPSATSGNYAHSATSGDYSPSATSGSGSHSATSGDYSPSATSGNYAPSATSGSGSHSATSGNYSPSATSGDYSPSATSGNYAHSATSGNYAPSATSGKDSIAAAIGRNAKAKAAMGSWIVLAEYKVNSRKVACVKTAQVDGKEIKANTFYELKNGKFVEAEE